MRTRLVALLVLTVSLAGCADNSDDAAAQDDGAVDGALMDGADDAVEEGPAILFEAEDPWGPNETERVLFDGTVQTAIECYAPFTLDGDAFIPRGTMELRVEADATDSLVTGSYHFDIHSRGGRWNGDAGEENSAEPVAEWIRPMGPIDWELAEEGSVAAMSFECSHQGGAHHMDGPIDATITAVRDPDWVHQPIHDPWPDLDPDLTPQEGVLTLLDSELIWSGGEYSNDLFARLGTKELQPDLPVPLGTSYLVLAATWETPSCRVANCEMNTHLEHDRAWLDGYAAEWDADGATYLVSWFAVPEHVHPPLPGAEEDMWFSVGATPVSCDPTNSCYLPYQGSASVRLLVEAWQGDVDVDAVKERLGV